MPSTSQTAARATHATGSLDRRHSAFQDMDLAAVCAELHEFFLPLAQAKGIAMSLAAATPVHEVGDPDLMREAIANLIDNALKFTPRGGAVHIAAMLRDGLACVEVADNGRGDASVDGWRADLLLGHMQLEEPSVLSRGGVRRAAEKDGEVPYGACLTQPTLRFTPYQSQGPQPRRP